MEIKNAKGLATRPCAASVFIPFMEIEFPHLVDSYRERYAKSAFLPPEYGKRISRLLVMLRKKHGMAATAHPDTRFGESFTVQDSLFR